MHLMVYIMSCNNLCGQQ